MGAGASVAHELAMNTGSQFRRGTIGLGVGPIESSYNEMLEHLKNVSLDEV